MPSPNRVYSRASRIASSAPRRRVLGSARLGYLCSSLAMSAGVSPMTGTPLGQSRLQRFSDR